MDINSSHPNPYFERKLWLSLDGTWDFSITKSGDIPESYGSSILVPFAVETKKSGIAKKISKDDFLHYRRKVELPEHLRSGLVRLCFTFVDQICDVYWNGVKVTHHEGGYLPFDVLVEPEKENILELVVTDDTDSPVFPRGKQSNNPHGIWYTATSGVYGPVYLEAVPRRGHITKFLIEPNIDKKRFKAKVGLVGELGEATVSCFFKGKKISEDKITKTKDGEYTCRLSACEEDGSIHPYELDDPNLYDFSVTFKGDEVTSHAGLRKFGVKNVDGDHLITMNDKPIFVSALLDQGYYEESGLTPPSYEALQNDIAFAKRLGFNCLRKHIKFEIPLFYYLCDKAGILVSQDIPNGGAKYKGALIALAPFLKLPVDDKHYRLLGRKSEDSRRFYMDSLIPSLEYAYNSASLFMYSPFNEGWGQFDSVSVTGVVSNFDHTRLVDSASGWFDQKAGDFNSKHVYFRRARLHNDHIRILSLSEFGGYSYRVEGHTYAGKAFSYKKFKSKEKLEKGFEKLFKKDVVKNIRKHGLSMAVLTQLSDVEGEINGLITFDRKVEKVDASLVRSLNDEAYAVFRSLYLK